MRHIQTTSAKESTAPDKKQKTSRASIADIHHGHGKYHHANDVGKEYAKVAATKGVSAYALT